ncbi:hypothetical protein [Paraburkholderia lacunae]|uniref:Uncharacterized protein n=1 Tax=Paraburkholderia lacunae TaxID=2211104 RepID=A0A370NBT9_9BURK|nr:hypothetical protein [Paraburkholderia lacunae]RDK03062.1 hypothetical protein DLM46_09170 [Paraburkholderia lacunae]
MFYFFAIPVVVIFLVKTHFGLLTGLLSGVATLVTEYVLVSWLGGKTMRKQAALAAASGAAEHAQPSADTLALAASLAAPAAPATVDTSVRVWRPTDRYLPVDELPYPIGRRSFDERDNEQLLPSYIGETACFDLIGFALSDNVKREPNAEALLHKQLYEGFREAIGSYLDIETGGDGTPAAMVSFDELAKFPTFAHFRNGSRALLTAAFRSRDAVWGGLRHDGESFRFPLGHLVGIRFMVWVPARGGGGYTVDLVFNVPRKQSALKGPSPYNSFYTGFNLDLPYSELNSFSVFAALTDIALLFDVRARCDTASDV